MLIRYDNGAVQGTMFVILDSYIENSIQWIRRIGSQGDRC